MFFVIALSSTKQIPSLRLFFKDHFTCPLSKKSATFQPFMTSYPKMEGLLLAD